MRRMLLFGASLAAGMIWAPVAQAGWHGLGGALNTDTRWTTSVGQGMAIVGGEPWVAWIEEGGSGFEEQLYVARWNGSAWVDVGGSLNGPGTTYASHPSIANVDGEAWVTWQEAVSQSGPETVVVAHWDSTVLPAGAWVRAGGDLGSVTNDPRANLQHITGIGGVPYVAFTEGIGTVTGYVKRWEGGAWVAVGANDGLLPDNLMPWSIAGVGGVPYVAGEGGGPGNVHQIRSASFGAGTWTASDQINHPSSEGLSGATIADVNGVPWITWFERGGPDPGVHVATGGGPVWTDLGGTAAPADAGFPLSLTTVAGVPYLAFGPYVANYNGSEWTAVGRGLLGSAVAEYSTLAANGGALYASWVDHDASASPQSYSEVAAELQFDDLHFSGATPTVGEAAAGAPITVQRVGDLEGPVIVEYATSNGTATEPDDYTATSGTLSFDDGEASETFTVPIIDDQGNDGGETINLALSNPGGAAVLDAPSTATLTIIDDDVINTAIASGPSSKTNDSTPTFTFTATPSAGSTFECAIDAAAFGPCSGAGTHTTASLVDGPHTFRVRAKNGPDTDPTPATRDFFVDTVAPTTDVKITPVPGFGSQLSGQTFAGAVSIGYDVSDPEPSGGWIAARCSFDPPSPAATYDDLDPVCPLTTSAVGTHTVYAAAHDFADNKGAVGSATFTIAPTPETHITSGPSGGTWEMASQFGFTADLPDVTYQCRVDGAAFAACKSGFLTAALKSGAHSFEVRAISPAGVADPTPARRDFSVNAKEVHRFSCEVRPYLRWEYDADANQPSGCWLGPAPDCDKDVRADLCTVISDTCPRGTKCTLEVRASWFDADRNARWIVGVFGSLNVQGPQQATSNPDCEARGNDDRCFARGSLTALGEGRIPTAGCDAVHNSFDGLGTRGPDSIRRLECEVTLTIDPAAPLTTLGGGSISIFAPGAGTLGISHGSGSGKLAAAAKPAFQPQTTTVDAAGPVTFKPKLSKKAKKTLKRKKTLALNVDVTFTPAGGGEALTSTQKVKLTRR